ncbi:MAG: sortase [Actinomycetota bacterium]
MSSRSEPDRLARWLRVAGTLCLFGAVGMAAFVVWVQWGTGFLTSRSQDRLRAGIEQRIGRAPSSPVVLTKGSAVAILRIPRIGPDMVVVEGTSSADLKKGPGHYTSTAYPWQRTGRVGIAGHRTTYLHPFWNLDKLSRGDVVEIDTEYGTFTYSVTSARVVRPTDVWVLRQTSDPTMVLTACTPRFSASHRLVVFAERVGGSGVGPGVRVPVSPGADEVGPADDLARPMIVMLAGSIAVGGVVLAGLRLRRERAGPPGLS